jgi:uncharacterized membrane protein
MAGFLYIAAQTENMNKARLETFSDGVFAIIITICAWPSGKSPAG